MKTQKLKMFSYVVLCLAVVFTLGLLGGCKGSDGSAGAAGPAGANGTNGSNGTNGTNGLNASDIVDFASLSNADDMASIQMTGVITSVTMGTHPVVNFKVTDAAGRGVTGLGILSTSTNTWSNLNYVHVAVATLGADPQESTTNAWHNYYVRSDQNYSPANEGLSSGLVDNGDGTYVYTFVNAITDTIDMTATHRVVVQISGNVPGSSPAIPLANPVNIVYTFVPNGSAVTVTRDIVSETACNGCHTHIGNTSLNGLGKSSSTPGHGGRITTKYCVMCHTSQNESSTAAGLVASTVTSTGLLVNPTVHDLANAGTTKTRTSTDLLSNGTNTYNQLEFVTMIHKTHRGEDLALQNYSINNGHYYPNDITYPQDRRNCTTCHVGPDASNWMNKPSIKACGSCHDNVSWASSVPTGFVAHVGGVQTDAQCALCHTPSDIANVHIPFDSPDTNATWNGGTNSNTNSAFIAAAPFGTNLPAGALAPAYKINSVTVNSGIATVNFTMTLGGNVVTFNTDTTSTNGMITGFIGSPSIVVAYGAPQDNATAPADFTTTMTFYLQNLWLGSAGTLTQQTDGSYTAVLQKTFNSTSSAWQAATIPGTATMVTAYMSPAYSLGNTTFSNYATNATYTWGTPPLTQTNVPAITFNGITVANFSLNATTGQGGLIVPAKVVYKTATNYTARRQIVDTNKCSTCHAPLGTEPTFHAGQRNNGEVCNICHMPNQNSSGWSANSNQFIHAIHSASFRNNQYTWHAASTTDGFWDVTYPAILNNCQACHVAGMYDYSSSAYSSTVMKNMLLVTGASGTVSTPATGGTSVFISPWTTDGAYYGAKDASTNLVLTPITSACFGCHDSAADIQHMQGTGGGAVYQQRSSALGNVEQCLICHGKGAIADIGVVHKY